jgi:hypothetical protein
MGVPKEVQKQADASVEYFQSDIDRMAECHEHQFQVWFGVHELLAKALAQSIAVNSCCCATKHCPECVAMRQLRATASARIHQYVKAWNAAMVLQEAYVATRNPVNIAHGAHFVHTHNPAVVYDFMFGALRYFAAVAPAIYADLYKQAGTFQANGAAPANTQLPKK